MTTDEHEEYLDQCRTTEHLRSAAEARLIRTVPAPAHTGGPGPYEAGLYSVRRVEAWIEANRGRVDRAREDRHRAALEWGHAVEAKVEGPLPDTLLEDAGRRHPNLSDKGLRAHVRHRLTNYESLLRKVRRNEFADELYPILRRRTDAAVQAVVQAALDEWRARHRAGVRDDLRAAQRAADDLVRRRDGG